MDNNTNKPNWLKRKSSKFSKTVGKYMTMGKQGFIMGTVSGGLVGLVFGLYETIKKKSILPIPIRVLSLSFIFGVLMGVTNLIRAESDKEINIIIYKYEMYKRT